MSDVLLWPVVGRGALVEAFRPGAATGEEASFRTLRRENLATTGVRVARRREGRLAGQLVVFSSLNVDAARLARAGQAEAGRRAATAAATVEAGTEFTRLRDLLKTMSGDEQLGVLHGRIPDGPQADEIRDLMIALAQLVVQARETAGLPPAADFFAGRVVEHRGSTVLVMGEDGVRTLLPEWMARSIHRSAVGDLLVVVTVRLDKQRAVIEAVPGIEFPKPRPSDQGAQPGSAYGRRDPSDLVLTSENFAALSGEPSALRVLVPVTIEE